MQSSTVTDTAPRLSARKLSVARYRSQYDPKPVSVDSLAWKEIIAICGRHEVRDKRDGPGISFVSLSDGASRKDASVLSMSAAVLDLDGGATLNAVIASIGHLEFVAYSTYSHVRKGPRFRLVFPLSRDIRPAEWPALWEHLNRISGANADQSGDQPSRMYFLPSCPPDLLQHAVVHHNKGRWLDPDHVGTGGAHVKPQTANVIPFGWRHPTNQGAAGGIELPPDPEAPCYEGSRNQTLAQLTGHWLSKGLVGDALLGEAKRWNADWCSPLMDDDEVERTVSSIVERHKQIDRRTERAVVPELPPGKGIPAPESAIVPLFDLDEARIGPFLDREPPKRRWLLNDCLPAGKVGAIIAPGGTGKSQFVIQLGASIASGVALAGGAWTIGEPGSVLVLASEDDSDELHRRVHKTAKLLVSEHGQRIRPLVEARLFVKSMVGVDNLMTKALHPSHREVSRTGYANRLIALVKQLPDLKLIIVDPASRFRGGEENSAEDITRFVEVLEYVSKQAGAAVIVVHHANKASMQGGEQTQAASRGSSAFSDGIRWQMNLSAMTKEEAKAHGIPEDQRQMYLSATVTKNNYAAPAAPVFLRRMSGGFLVKADLAEKVKRKEQTTVLQVVQKISSSRESYSSRSFTEAFGGTTNLFGIGQNKLGGFVNQAIEAGLLRKGDDTRGLLRVTELGTAVLQASTQPDSAIVQ